MASMCLSVSAASAAFNNDGGSGGGRHGSPSLLLVDNLLQARPQLRPIRYGQRRPKMLDRLPIRLQHRGIHAIQRGSAHQPDDQHVFRFRSPRDTTSFPESCWNTLPMTTSAFLLEAAARGFVHQCTDTEALAQGAQRRTGQRLYRLRLHRRFATCRQSGADHADAFAAKTRSPAAASDGRRHHEDRRPFRQGRNPSASLR